MSHGYATPMRGKSLTCRKLPPKVWRSVTAYKRVGDPKKGKGVFRQVRDLPRIGVAEPLVQVYSEPALTILLYGRVTALTGCDHGTNILSSIQFSQITI